MQYLEEFTSYLTQKKLSKATIKNYSKDVLRFIAWNEEKGETPFYPQAVQQEHITHYIYSLKVSSASKQRHLSSLRKFFAFLKSEGIIGKTPGSLPIWVKPKEPQELSSGQRSSDTMTSRPFSPYSTESQTPFGQEIKNKEETLDTWKLTDFSNYLYIYNASELTIKHYMIDLKHFFQWMNTTNQNVPITDTLVKKYKDYLTKHAYYAKSTINRKHSAIRKYLLFSFSFCSVPRSKMMTSSTS